MIVRSRKQSPVITRSPNPPLNYEENEKNEEHVYRFSEGRAGPGSDRVHAAYGIRGAGFGRPLHRRRRQREGHLDGVQHPAGLGQHRRQLV